MRLAILDSGHGFRTKVLFAFIRAVSRLPVPDAVKMNRDRPNFYGMPMGAVAQEAMRGRSAWSVGDRELMGASVSKINECECCTKVHAAVAALAYRDAEKVSTALSDLETAVIGEPLRATLRMLRKLTREHRLTRTTCARYWPQASQVSRSKTRSRSPLRSTRSIGCPVPSGSSCRVQRPSRPAPSSCSRAAIVDHGRLGPHRRSLPPPNAGAQQPGRSDLAQCIRWSSKPAEDLIRSSVPGMYFFSSSWK
jgi:AhpD family alkylhydroperoxidase